MSAGPEYCKNCGKERSGHLAITVGSDMGYACVKSWTATGARLTGTIFEQQEAE